MNCDQRCHRAERRAWARLPNSALVLTPRTRRLRLEFAGTPWVPQGVGGGLGTALQLQLREDAAHVVLGGAPADEQASRQLVIGETKAEQLEHLALATAQWRAALRPGAARTAEALQQRTRRIGLRNRSQAFERD